MIVRYRHVYRSPEAGGDGGAASAPPAGGAAAPAASAPPAGSPPAAAPAVSSPAPAPSALGGGAATPGAPPAAGTPPAPPAADPVWGVIPEKFRVKDAAGLPDMNASWAKVEEHRGHLERRLGSGEAPPKEATDYKLAIPETLADKLKADELVASPAFQTWRAEMHKAGLSQKQFDQAVGAMLSLGIAQRQGASALDEQGCVAELKKSWSSDADYTSNVRAAYRAGEAYGEIDKLMAKYGNDPDFIRFAANVGKELGEDTSAGADAAGASEMDVEALTKSEAYWNANDPQHTATKAKVEAFYQRKFGNGPKSANSIATAQIG